jgi:4'-phosphopantetheinyl transferase
MKPGAAPPASAGTPGDWAEGPERPALGTGVVHVWRADLQTLGDELCELLCEQELARAQRLLSGRGRLLWTRSRGLLRALLGRYLALDPRALRFLEGPHGKPELAGPRDGRRLPVRDGGARTGRLSFNLSHSGRLALYAFCADGAVGVDVEVERRSIDEAAIAARMFGAHEAERLRMIADPGARRTEFLRRWTRYEAELKCLGSGIAAGSSGARGRRVWVSNLEPATDAAGAVACVWEPAELCCWTWPLAERSARGS